MPYQANAMCCLSRGLLLFWFNATSSSATGLEAGEISTQLPYRLLTLASSVTTLDELHQQCRSRLYVIFVRFEERSSCATWSSDGRGLLTLASVATIRHI